MRRRFLFKTMSGNIRGVFLLANLDLQNTIFALGDVVALAETMQLHLGLPGGHFIRGADKISVHIEQHNIAGCIKRIAGTMEIHLSARENGRQSDGHRATGLRNFAGA